MPKWQCMHCLRDNFKTQGGLKQHQRTHNVCSQLDKIIAIDVTKSASKSGTNKHPKKSAKNGQIESDSIAEDVDNFAQLSTKRARLLRQFAAKPESCASAHECHANADGCSPKIE